MTRPVVALLFVASLPAIPHAQGKGPAVPTTRFLKLLTDYRQGNADAAVDALSRWSEREVTAEAVAPAETADAWTNAAYAQLLTEASMRGRMFGKFAEGTPTALNLGGWGLESVFEPSSYRAFLAIKRLTAQGKRAKDDRILEFSRSWYIAAVSYCLRWERPWAVRELRDFIDHEFGDDPQIHLLLGSVSEAASRPTPSLSCPPYNGPHGCVLDAQEALWQFRQALKGDPTLIEARLRLGRMLHLIGWEKDARGELDRVLADSAEANHVFGTYMSALFLGEIDEEMHGVDDKLAQAARHYQIAVDAVPRAHMARLALGQVLVRDGKDNGWLVARQMLEGEGSVRAAVPDPYDLYRYAQDWQLASRMRTMRAWVRK